MSNGTIRDFLYEVPGPRTRRRIHVATGIAAVGLLGLMVLVIRQFAATGQLSPRYWSFFLRATTWTFLGQGLLTTIEVALTSALISFVAAFLLLRLRLRRSPVLRAVSAAIIEFTRGVPTLLFIYFFFLVVPQFGWRLTAFWKITLPVAISACGVVSEVLRSGINSVPKGQTEAALCLGLTETRTFYRIIFPQGIRYVVPTLIAELVIVLKDTTFAYIVSCADLMQNARVLISNYDSMLSVYLVVAVIYILINYLLNRLSDRIATRSGRRASSLPGGISP